MKHIDEGTIHAWLDGALSAAEANEVSQHAASCAECGALVAEARGLIAGASRILTSLDDVPAVVPKRAPVVAPAKPQRFWQAAPWVTGIAAALILAVGIKEWMDRPQAKAAFEPVHVVMDSLRAAPIPTPAPVDSALRAKERRPLAPVSAPPPSVPRLQASGAGASGGGPVGEQRQRAEPARKDATADEIAHAKVVAAPPGAMAAAPVTAQVAVPVAAKSSLEDLADRSRDNRLSSSCYRLDAVLVRESFAKGAVTTRASARNAPAAAPSAVAAEPSVAQIVRLDTAGTNRIRVVTSLSGEPIGTWTLEGDTVRAILRTLGTRAIPLTIRVACPTQP